MKFHNFDLVLDECTAATDALSVQVAVSRTPLQSIAGYSEAVPLPEGLRTLHRQAQCLAERTLSLPALVEFGRRLADVLLPGRVARDLEQSLARLPANDRLRLRLMFHSTRLAALPWEYVFLDHDGAGEVGFLALDRRFSLVRYAGIADVEPEPVRGALGLVAFFASPDDPDYPPLDLRAERRYLRRALTGQPIAVRARTNPDIATLQDVLAGHEPVHIVHFAGHGDFRGDPRADGQGCLVLVGPDGAAQEHTGQDLARHFKNTAVRLAVLSACHSGTRDWSNHWSGVAQALIAAGIPAVVGMQFSIRNDSAEHFARSLYRALIINGDSIDAAVTEGRLAIYGGRTTPDERDWGAPVLYLRTEQGILFPPPSSLKQARRRSNPGEFRAASGSKLTVGPSADAAPPAAAAVASSAIRPIVTSLRLYTDSYTIMEDIQFNARHFGRGAAQRIAIIDKELQYQLVLSGLSDLKESLFLYYENLERHVGELHHVEQPAPTDTTIAELLKGIRATLRSATPAKTALKRLMHAPAVGAESWSPASAASLGHLRESLTDLCGAVEHIEGLTALARPKVLERIKVDVTSLARAIGLM